MKADSHNVRYVLCPACKLPDHPGWNCEAEAKRLMDYAKSATDDTPVPYMGYPGVRSE